jgi:hypothetical protein
MRRKKDVTECSPVRHGPTLSLEGRDRIETRAKGLSSGYDASRFDYCHTVSSPGVFSFRLKRLAMRKTRRPICPRCGVQDSPSHRSGFIHNHINIILSMIENGYGNRRIVRTLRQGSNGDGVRSQIRSLRMRLARLSVSGAS